MSLLVIDRTGLPLIRQVWIHLRGKAARGMAVLGWTYCSNAAFSLTVGLPWHTARDRGRRKKLANLTAKRRDEKIWLRGFATALADVHRQLIGGCESQAVRTACRDSAVTLDMLCAAGCCAVDVRELRRAGVPGRRKTEEKNNG